MNFSPLDRGKPRPAAKNEQFSSLPEEPSHRPLRPARNAQFRPLAQSHRCPGEAKAQRLAPRTTSGFLPRVRKLRHEVSGLLSLIANIPLPKGNRKISR
jgi:hypothetical protein